MIPLEINPWELLAWLAMVWVMPFAFPLMVSITCGVAMSNLRWYVTSWLGAATGVGSWITFMAGIGLFEFSAALYLAVFAWCVGTWVICRRWNAREKGKA